MQNIKRNPTNRYSKDIQPKGKKQAKDLNIHLAKEDIQMVKVATCVQHQRNTYTPIQGHHAPLKMANFFLIAKM